MFIDYRTDEGAALVEADLCVIGAGAAGIIIAREFIGSDLTVCLLESGGFDFSPDTQDLYEGQLVGLPYTALDVTRLRYFGGTTNHWAGWSAPFNASDFEPKPWMRYSGWPISRSDLDPYYERAHPLFDLGPFVYDDRVWQSFGIEPPPLNPRQLEYCFWQRSPPTRFGKVFREALRDAGNVRVLLHANATDIRTGDAGDTSLVDHVEVQTLDGKSGQVRARAYVLACGGIENARLLLVSNRQVEPAGLGNRHGLVGRFFIEHPRLACGEVVTNDSAPLVRACRRRTQDGVPYRTGFRLSEQARAREQVFNGSAELMLVPGDETGLGAAIAMWHALRGGRVPDDLTDKVWRVVTDLDGIARYAYDFWRGEEYPATASISRLVLRATSEQAPNPDSRVTLSATERDALGLPRPQLDWGVTENDKRTIRVLTTTIGAELARLGLGRVRLEDWLLEGANSWPPELQGNHHHIGTTRMADDPKAGVVDRDCRVHATDNLYVAGASVFPTGSYVNPTLTIGALALRLADHLKERFAPSGP